MSVDIAVLEEKRVCADCVRETFLQALIVQDDLIASCDYCEEEGPTMPIGDLADLVDKAFRRHYRRTATVPSDFQYAMQKDPDYNYQWTRSGLPVVESISNTAEIPFAVAEDIQSILENKYRYDESEEMGGETPYHADSHYEFSDVNSSEWHSKWRSFEISLRTQNRFFSPIAADYLTSLFAGVERLVTIDGSPVLVEAGPDSRYEALFRARVFQSETKLLDALKNVSRELGPSPPVAALAGRMNARGISVFYGATDPAVAIAEVRPPVGSLVLTARFNIVRPLKLLDVGALEAVAIDGSMFDPRYSEALEKAAFLMTFSKRIMQAVMPDDEALDYVITQAVADFLATDKNNPLDGLVYRSVQAPASGVNVVLFHKSARVETIDRPPGTDVDTHSGYYEDDGWHTEYKVLQWVPVQDDKPIRRSGGLGDLFVDWPAEKYDDANREVTLQADIKSVKVEAVTAVKFETVSNAVSFHRLEKRDDYPI